MAGEVLSAEERATLEAHRQIKALQRDHDARRRRITSADHFQTLPRASSGLPSGELAPAPAPRVPPARPPASLSAAIAVRPAELCTPASYATEADLPAELCGLCRQHRAELTQRAAALGCSPTLAAILELLRPFHGIHRGGQVGDRRRLNGRGLQIPLRALARVLGRDKSTVCDALLEGADLRWIQRYAPTRTVRNVTGGRLERVTTKDGRERNRINVHGVLYLTPAGARALEAAGRGYSRVRRYTRNGPARELRAVGLVGFLFTTLARAVRAIAARCASAPTHPTPYGDLHPSRSTLGRQIPPVDAQAPPARGEVSRWRATDQVTAGDPVRSAGGASVPTLAEALRAVLIRSRGRRAPRALEGGDFKGRADLDVVLELTPEEARQVLALVPGPDRAWPAHWRGASAERRCELAALYESLRRAAR